MSKENWESILNNKIQSLFCTALYFEAHINHNMIELNNKMIRYFNTYDAYVKTNEIESLFCTAPYFAAYGRNSFFLVSLIPVVTARESLQQPNIYIENPP